MAFRVGHHVCWNPLGSFLSARLRLTTPGNGPTPSALHPHQAHQENWEFLEENAPTCSGSGLLEKNALRVRSEVSIHGRPGPDTQVVIRAQSQASVLARRQRSRRRPDGLQKCLSDPCTPLAPGTAFQLVGGRMFTLHRGPGSSLPSGSFFFAFAPVSRD